MEAHTASTVEADEASSASRGTKRDSPEQSSMMEEDTDRLDSEDQGAAPGQKQGQGGEHNEDERRVMEEEEDCADKSADQPQDEAVDGAAAEDSVAGAEEEDGEGEEEEDVEESEHRPPILDGRNVRTTPFRRSTTTVVVVAVAVAGLVGTTATHALLPFDVVDYSVCRVLCVSCCVRREQIIFKTRLLSGFLVCQLCMGVLRDAHTIRECLHTCTALFLTARNRATTTTTTTTTTTRCSVCGALLTHRGPCDRTSRLVLKSARAACTSTSRLRPTARSVGSISGPTRSSASGLTAPCRRS
jgi:hypothetical protein